MSLSQSRQTFAKLARANPRLELAVFLLLSLGLFGFVLSQGVRFGGDTHSYLDASDYRSPGYVWVILAYDGLFGGQEPAAAPERYILLVGFQCLFGLFGAWLLTRTLQTIFVFPSWLAGIVYLTLLTPYFFGDYRFANTVQSEGVTYPLFFIAISLLLLGLTRRKLGFLFGFLPLLFLLVITRKQFLFVYPAFAIVLLYVFLLFPRDAFKKALLTVCFLATAVAANLVERADIHGRTGKFETIPFTGIQLIAAPMYLSREADKAAFADSPDRLELFEEFREKAKARGRHLETVTGKEIAVNHYYNHFAASYGFIVFQVVVRTLRERGITDWFEIDAITTDMAWKLIWANPVGFVQMYFHNVKFALGGYYMMLFLAVIFCLALVMHLVQRDKLSLCLFFVILFHFGNLTTVALVETIIRRYSSYTETVLTAVLIIATYLLLCRQSPAEDPFA